MPQIPVCFVEPCCHLESILETITLRDVLYFRGLELPAHIVFLLNPVESKDGTSMEEVGVVAELDEEGFGTDFHSEFLTILLPSVPVEIQDVTTPDGVWFPLEHTQLPYGLAFLTRLDFFFEDCESYEWRFFPSVNPMTVHMAPIAMFMLPSEP